MLEMHLPETSYDKCLKCNACTVNCPVVSTTLEFGGPKHLGPELQRLIENQEVISDSRIDLCTLCGNCDISCPENVEVSVLTAYAKAIYKEKEGIKFRDILLSNAEFVGKMASTFAPITNMTMKMKPMRKIMEATMGMAAERRFPDYTFHHLKRTYKKKEATTKRKVAYFAGCYTIYNAPNIGHAFIKVMEHNGIEVALPDQKCCGVPKFTNGRLKQGIENATYNINILLEYVQKGYDIVATCTSCTLALKKEYSSFVQTEEAEKLSAHVYDANEYLLMLKDAGELNMNFKQMEEKAGYFAPCHMKAQGIGSPAMDILELIPGYTIQDYASSCCGQCGTFGFKKEKYGYSMVMGQKIQRDVQSVDSSYTVTECGMCTNQLNQLTTKEVKHPIEVLAYAYEN